MTPQTPKWDGTWMVEVDEQGRSDSLVKILAINAVLCRVDAEEHVQRVMRGYNGLRGEVKNPLPN